MIRRLSKIIIIAFFVVIVLFAAFYGAAWYYFYQTNVEKQSINYKEAVSDSSVTNVWIPNFMPGSATNIFVKFGIDPSYIILEFNYQNEDEDRITANFRKIYNEEEKEYVIQRMKRVDWTDPIDISENVIVYVPISEIDRVEEIKRYMIIDINRKKIWYSVY